MVGCSWEWAASHSNRIISTYSGRIWFFSLPEFNEFESRFVHVGLKSVYLSESSSPPPQEEMNYTISAAHFPIYFFYFFFTFFGFMKSSQLNWKIKFWLEVCRKHFHRNWRVVSRYALKKLRVLLFFTQVYLLLKT